MTHDLFRNTSAQQAWTPATEVEVLLRYIATQGSDDAFKDFIEQQAAEENALADEGPGEDASELRIPSYLNSDDSVACANFNAAPWFEQASDDEILDVAKAEFASADATDQVALFFEKTDLAVDHVFTYLNFHPKASTGDAIGYTSTINASHAFLWIKKNKPHLFEPAVRAAHEDLESVNASIRLLDEKTS